jgi:hypothetical protein
MSAEKDGLKRGQDDEGGDDVFPAYSGTAHPRDVFAQFCFYKDRRDFEYEASRRDTFFENNAHTILTVRQLAKKYDDGSKRGCIDLADELGARASQIQKYFDQRFKQSAEAILADEGILPLGSEGWGDFETFQAQEAIELPVLDELINRQYAMLGEKGERDRKISFVIGTSGAGKTFFALKYLPGFRAPVGMKYVGLYLHAIDTGGVFKTTGGETTGSEVAKKLVEDIRAKLSEEEVLNKALPLPPKLAMHVCVIFDEAGDSDLSGWFEVKDNLTLLCKQLEKNLAESVMVVVAGTGVTGTYLNSQGDAYKFRMMPWRSDDLKQYLLRENRVRGLDLRGGETVRDVVDAIIVQPKLRALATNARSAHFMIQAIRFLSSKYARDYWTFHLEAIAPAVVTRVMHRYIDTNGLKDLDWDERRIVAASVFYALKEARAGFGTGSYGPIFPPSFPLLRGKAKSVANALVTSNVNRIDDDRRVELFESTMPALTVTPAIAMVLYTLAGVRLVMNRDWRGAEEVTALNAVRRSMLNAYSRCRDQENVGRLKTDLNQIELFYLSQQIESPRNRSTVEEIADKKALEGTMAADQEESQDTDGLRGQVKVPMVRKASILVNGRTAKFADVMAPYMLMQSKHSSQKSKSVAFELEDELRKCCLLKDCTDDRVLRGLLAVWRGAFESEGELASHAYGTHARAKRGADDCDEHDSKAYPENLVKYSEPFDSVQYAWIESGSELITIPTNDGGDVKTIPLPALDSNETITYVIVTNAKTLRLKLGDDATLKVSDDVLNADMGLNTTTVKSYRSKGKVVKPLQKWTEIIDKVKVGVKIEFLFTGSE